MENENDSPIDLVFEKDETDMDPEVAKNLTQQASYGFNIAAQAMNHDANFFGNVLKNVTAKNLAELDSIEAAANDRIINSPRPGGPATG
jgi:type IV secretory pathway VirB4 component